MGEGASGEVHILELDITSQETCAAAVARIVDDQGRLDVAISNAGHMYFGITEAFTAQQLLEAYNTELRWGPPRQLGRSPGAAPTGRRAAAVERVRDDAGDPAFPRSLQRRRNPTYLACTSGGPRIYLGGDPGVTALRPEALALLLRGR
ncbi:MAG: SDR family NAD(P)-dependent oxidoreductase [Actinomycetota bacterium]|nr:SDR family NAD(P)-dependent oxidoreductase [Actinomycetota bacterium]